MTEVFRVENEKSLGPYAVGIPGISPNGAPHQPSPMDDGLGFILHYEHSGFKSIRQLLRWFKTHEELYILEKSGFHVSVIDAPEKTIRRGKHHLVFRDEPPNLLPVKDEIAWEDLHYQLETKFGVPETAKGAGK